MFGSLGVPSNDYQVSGLMLEDWKNKKVPGYIPGPYTPKVVATSGILRQQKNNQPFGHLFRYLVGLVTCVFSVCA